MIDKKSTLSKIYSKKKSSIVESQDTKANVLVETHKDTMKIVVDGTEFIVVAPSALAGIDKKYSNLEKKYNKLLNDFKRLEKQLIASQKTVNEVKTKYSNDAFWKRYDQ